MPAPNSSHHIRIGILCHSDQPGLSLSPGGPPAGFLAGVVGHWGVRRQPGSVIGKVWFNGAANAMRQGVVPIRAAARRHLSPSSGLSPLSLVLIFSDFFVIGQPPAGLVGMVQYLGSAVQNDFIHRALFFVCTSVADSSTRNSLELVLPIKRASGLSAVGSVGIRPGLCRWSALHLIFSPLRPPYDR